MNPHANGKKRPRSYKKHGLYALRRAINGQGMKAIDWRSSVGRALRQWRSNLIQDLGGEDTVSTQQLALVDLAVKSKMLLDSVDAWLLTQKSLINLRRKSLLPVVRERQQLADGLARYLAQLGLERKAKDVSDLTRELARIQEDSQSDQAQEARQ